MKRSLIIVGSVLIIGLLAAGMFTAVRLLAQGGGDTAVATSPGKVMESIATQDGGPPVAVRTAILPADELPAEPSAASGLVSKREDNTLMIGTGAVELEVDVSVDEAGNETMSAIPSTSGPDVEVVIGRDTLIYEDVTDLTVDGLPESGEREVQQAVRLVETAVAIKETDEIEVWGEKRGDRIVATIIVYGPLGGGAFE